MFGRRGRSAGSIFTTGPTHDDRPFGTRVGERGQQLQVHALVDHAVEAEARAAAERAWSAGLGTPRARLGEVGAVDAGREGVDVGVPVLLGLVQAVAAGEDHVGGDQQLALQRRAAPAGRT